MRGQELKRQENLILQEQITKDYIATHSKIAHKNKNYPLTEKIVTGTPEELKAILSSDVTDETQLEINPSDYPEGLVLQEGFFDVNMP